jgi:hypothetical protein
VLTTASKLFYGIHTSCGVHLRHLGVSYLDVKRLGRKIITDTYLMPELEMNGARPPLSLPAANRHNFICTASPPEIKDN